MTTLPRILTAALSAVALTMVGSIAAAQGASSLRTTDQPEPLTDHAAVALDNIEITLEEVAEGVERQLKLRKFVACDHCDGTGAEDKQDGYSTCGTCGGSGEVRQVSTSFFGQFVNVQPCPTCQG